MWSYAIQGVTSLLFGPALGVVSLYAGSDRDSDSFLALPAKLWVSELFVPVARSIRQANIIIAFSVLTATLIRVSQVCPVAERNFLQHLVGYEALAAVICTLSYLPMHESSRLKKTAMVFFVLGTIIMVLIAQDWTGLGADPYVSAFEALAKYCVQKHDWPVPEISFAPPASSKPPTPDKKLPTWLYVLLRVTKPFLGLLVLWTVYLLFRVACIFVSILFLSPLRSSTSSTAVT